MLSFYLILFLYILFAALIFGQQNKTFWHIFFKNKQANELMSGELSSVVIFNHYVFNLSPAVCLKIWTDTSSQLSLYLSFYLQDLRNYENTVYDLRNFAFMCPEDICHFPNEFCQSVHHKLCYQYLRFERTKSNILSVTIRFNLFWWYICWYSLSYL